jgi:hypothetical protein
LQVRILSRASPYILFHQIQLIRRRAKLRALCGQGTLRHGRWGGGNSQIWRPQVARSNIDATWQANFDGGQREPGTQNNHARSKQAMGHTDYPPSVVPGSSDCNRWRLHGRRDFTGPVVAVVRRWGCMGRDYILSVPHRCHRYMGGLGEVCLRQRLSGTTLEKTSTNLGAGRVGGGPVLGCNVAHRSPASP